MLTDIGKLHGEFMTATMENTGSLIDEPWLAGEQGTLLGLRQDFAPKECNWNSRWCRG
jgi:hypothetical protein